MARVSCFIARAASFHSIKRKSEQLLRTINVRGEARAINPERSNSVIVRLRVSIVSPRWSAMSRCDIGSSTMRDFPDLFDKSVRNIATRDSHSCLGVIHAAGRVVAH